MKIFARSIHDQWPCELPRQPDTQNAHTYINMESVMSVLRVKFKAWYENHLFYGYTQDIADALGNMSVVNAPTLSRQSTRSVEKPANESDGSFGTREIFDLPPPLSANSTCKY
jgi:hypothetical protein